MSKANYANRGMMFEEMINYTNAQYERKGIASIRKVSTPWKVIRNGKRIVSAFPDGPSTVDYMGDFNGKSVCFEAKSTKSATSFPLSNFEEHQIEFIRKWKGIAFALIHFEEYNKTFFLHKDWLLQWWDGQFKGERKSIPVGWLIDHTEQVPTGMYLVNYLDILGR